MIVYNKLWQTMKQKKVSQYRLIKTYGFSRGQISRIKANKNLSTHTLDVLCQILDCSINDIMEFKKNPQNDNIVALCAEAPENAEAAVTLEPGASPKSKTKNKTRGKKLSAPAALPDLNGSDQ